MLLSSYSRLTVWQWLLQELQDVERSSGRPKAVDKYREETLWSQIVHAQWVSKVQHLPELESAVSCALDGLLWLMDVERRCAAHDMDAWQFRACTIGDPLE
jgi:hypothetical protein